MSRARAAALFEGIFEGRDSVILASIASKSVTLEEFGRTLADVAGDASAISIGFSNALRRARRATRPDLHLGRWFAARLPNEFVLAIYGLEFASDDVLQFVVAIVEGERNGRVVLAASGLSRLPVGPWLTRRLIALPHEASTTRHDVNASGQAREADVLESAIEEGDGDRIVEVLDAIGFPMMEAHRDDVVERAARLLDDAQRARCAPALVIAAMRQSELGHLDVSDSWFEHARAAALDSAARAHVDLEFGCDLLRRGRPDALAILERAAKEPGDEQFRARALASLAAARAAFESSAAASEAISKALAIAGAWPERFAPDTRARVHRQAAFVLLRTGDIARAVNHAWSAIEIAERFALADISAAALSVLLEVTTVHGDDDGLPLLQRLEAAASEIEHVFFLRYALLGQAECYAERADWAAFDRLCRRLEKLEVENDMQHAGETLGRGRALRAAAFGDFAKAFALLLRVPEDGSSGEHLAFLRAEKALYAAASGETLEALRLSAAVDTALEGRAAIALGIRADVFAALAEALAGEPERAARRLERARLGVPMLPRLRLLVSSANAAATILANRIGGDDLIESLERLAGAGFVALAALIGSLPLRLEALEA